MKKLLPLLAFMFLGIFTANAQKHVRVGLYAGAGNFTLPRKQPDILLLFPKGSNEFQLKSGFSGNLGIWTDQTLGKRFRLYESLGFRYNRYDYKQTVSIPDYETVQNTSEANISATLPVLLFYTPAALPKWSIFGGIGLSYYIRKRMDLQATEQFLPKQPDQFEEHYRWTANSPLNAFLTAGLQYEIFPKTWLSLEYSAENSFESYHFIPAGSHYANSHPESIRTELIDGFGINMRSFSVSLRRQLWP